MRVSQHVSEQSPSQMFVCSGVETGLERSSFWVSMFFRPIFRRSHFVEHGQVAGTLNQG